MPAKLDRLTPAGQITDQGGVASSWFINLWQRTMTAIEQRLADLQALLAGQTQFSLLNVNGATVSTLGNAAARSVGTTTGTVAAGDDSRITGAVQKASNLSDLASASAARGNLGLGDAAVLSVGTTAGTVAAGDDSRIIDAKAVYQTISTDADFTILRTASLKIYRHTGTLTADRAATLSTANAVAGDCVRLTRTGTGAFNLTFAGKALITNTWALASFDGAAWYLAAYGAL